jgi:hypothetical protein
MWDSYEKQSGIKINKKKKTIKIFYFSFRNH